MTITLANLNSYITQAYSTLDSNFPGGDFSATTGGIADENVYMINQAGRWFYSHHPWNFREQASATISFAGGETYVEMPNDFQAMVGIQMTNGLNYSFQWTDIQDLLRRRSTTLSVTLQSYWGVLTQPSQLSKKEGMPPWRLELWPNTVALSNAMTIWYRRGWANLLEDTDAANVPEYCELPLAMAVRELALGFGEQYVRGMEYTDRMEKLKQSTFFQDAYAEDGLAQPDYGKVGGGGIATLYRTHNTWQSASSQAVGDPS
jgi:hypothetical protein